MEFLDFEIRAWRTDKTHIQAIVHSSPAGDMDKPITVAFDEFVQWKAQHSRFRTPLAIAIERGKQLSAALLPRPIEALLSRSLELSDPGAGLRMRLCLDETLAKLPWEYLFRPDAPAPDSLAGFLVLDPRISIVRGAPTTIQTIDASEESQQLVFAGMLEGGESDRQQVQKEFKRISTSLEPIAHLLSAEFVTGSGNQIEAALQQPAAIFHFSGYTSAENGKGFLIREIDPPPLADCPRLYSETMTDLLRKAGTRLAFFNANDSYRWDFIEPLVRADIPAIIGMYGATSVDASIGFAQKLYAVLAKGLSLDEAVTEARLQLVQASSRDRCEWGQFVVYMPTATSVLLARPKSQEASRYQEQARDERQQTISAAIGIIGKQPRGEPPVNKRDLRQAMLKAFNPEELETLCSDVEQDLADDGITLRVSLDVVGQDAGQEDKIRQLIEYLDRRAKLPYLIRAVRRARDGIVF